MAKSSGNGISDAVRKTVRSWMDHETVEAIRAAAVSAGYPVLQPLYLTDPDSWARQKRLGTKATGFVRPYRNNGVNPKLGLKLEVRTDKEDRTIEYFVIKVGDKIITGGDCRVSSVLIKPRKADEARIGKAIVTEGPTFRRFTARQIEKINVNLDFGDRLDQLFEER